LARYRQGRAPEFLRDCFVAAVMDSVHGTRTPGSRLFRFNMDLRRQWDRWDTESRLYWTSGQLWRSNQPMPDHVCDALGLERGSTFGRGARHVRARLSKGSAA
jgi:hypothetical protein